MNSPFTTIAAFTALAAILVVTPGVGTATLIGAVATHGRRSGYLMATGMVLGASLYALAAALGTSALLRVFPSSLRWIGMVGGGIIVVIGVKGIASALRPATGIPDQSRESAFITTGLIIALGNASFPLFYLVVVPQYVPKPMSSFGGAILLSSIHLLMAATWMASLVTLLGRLVEVLRRPLVYLLLRLLSGGALILLGAKSISGAVK